MIFFTRNLFPYLCFSSSAIGIIIGIQQVNLTQLTMAFVFCISVLAFTLGKFKTSNILPFWWFLLASLPGTAVLILKGQFYIPLRQYLVILIGWLAISFFFYIRRYVPTQIFGIYLKSALIFSIYGILQQIAYILDISFLYDSRWLFIGASEYTTQGPFLRVPSFFTEPSYFGLFLLPAVYFSFLSIGSKLKAISVSNSWVFITACIFTFSTWTFLGLLITAIIAFKPSLDNIKISFWNLILLLFIFLFLAYAVISIPVINSRLVGIPEIFNSGITGDENISLLTVGINLQITIESFLQNSLFGSGLGSYRLVSEEYLGDLFGSNSSLYSYLTSNKEMLMLADGGMMYFRLPVEIGIFGCAILFYFLIRNFRKIENPIHHHIGIASAIFIVGFSLRSGQIFRFELLYFVALCLLIYSKKFNSYN